MVVVFLWFFQHLSMMIAKMRIACTDFATGCAVGILLVDIGRKQRQMLKCVGRTSWNLSRLPHEIRSITGFSPRLFSDFHGKCYQDVPSAGAKENMLHQRVGSSSAIAIGFLPLRVRFWLWSLYVTAIFAEKILRSQLTWLKAVRHETAWNGEKIAPSQLRLSQACSSNVQPHWYLHWRMSSDHGAWFSRGIPVIDAFLWSP